MYLNCNVMHRIWIAKKKKKEKPKTSYERPSLEPAQFAKKRK